MAFDSIIPYMPIVSKWLLIPLFLYIPQIQYIWKSAYLFYWLSLQFHYGSRRLVND